MELVIMAGGLGTRFGGLKQLEPVDKFGNFIIDYSIYDAICCGCNKVIFVIRKENYFLFKNSIGKRIENKIKVEYVFQNDEKNIPSQIPQERFSPLGTGHTIYCVKDVVKSPFVVINADDFYGREAFCDATKFIKNNKEKNVFGIVCYNIKNTIYKNKIFNRGICFCDKQNFLTKIVECSVQKTQHKIIAKNKNNNDIFEIKPNQNVSMNMFVFYPTIFEFLKKNFENFLIKNKKDLLSVEYELPSFVTNLIDKKVAKIKILKTKPKWFGLTYKEDKNIFQKYLNKEINNKKYPQNLWKK